MRPYEHYLEAERLLAEIDDVRGSILVMAQITAEAQVHATLAMVGSLNTVKE